MWSTELGHSQCGDSPSFTHLRAFILHYLREHRFSIDHISSCKLGIYSCMLAYAFWHLCLLYPRKSSIAFASHL